jgi:hypothetical protein
MTKETKLFLTNLVVVLQEGFKALEDRCQPSLEWEIDKLKTLEKSLKGL